MKDLNRRQFLGSCVAGAATASGFAGLVEEQSLQAGRAGDIERSPGDIIIPPKGGGALSSIGERFSPDLFTGTGNYTLPIEVPAGRNGFQPSLALSYSSGNGNSPFGLGWSITTPSISRKTAKGTPAYIDDSDIFVFTGEDDLIVIDQRPGATEYRCRTEVSFSKFIHLRDAGSGSDYWEVMHRDGSVSTYGTPRPGDASTDWIDPAVITDPANRDRLFSWKPTATRDPFGNTIRYSYKREATRRDGLRAWDQVFLSRVSYVDVDATTLNYLVQLDLEYGARPDPFSEYRAGFEIRTNWRCRRLVLTVNTDPPQRVRSYELKYHDEITSSTGAVAPNLVSLLAQIGLVGYDDSTGESESLPAVTFSYSRFDPSARRSQVVTGADLPSKSLADPRHELADLFGRGLPDLVEIDEVVRYWRNLGAGRFDRPRTMEVAPTHRLGDPNVALIDANGDGLAELVVSTRGLAGFYPLKDGAWDSQSFQRWEVGPSIPLGDPQFKLVDLDGDGVTDAVRSGSSLECYFNDPPRGWVRTARVARRSLDVFPNVDLDDPRVRLADMTGDGLADVVLLHGGRIDYWPSLGRGEFAPRVTMKNAPKLPYGYNPRNLLLGDVDGDGAADLVYIDSGRVTLWINQSGNGWSPAIEIVGTPAIDDISSVRLVDLLGAGVAGILWSRDAGFVPRPTMFFLDLLGGAKPYLLTGIDNGVGAETAISYASSSKYRLNDVGTSSQWKTHLPFPVHVVSRVDFLDRITGGKLTSLYDYHHGYWDGADREFRGFGRVYQRDSETFTEYAQSRAGTADDLSVPIESFSPPTETRSWFHLGPVGEEYGTWGQIDYSAEFWQGDPPAFDPNYAVSPSISVLPRRAQRDAIRALRGRMLRQEVYSADETARAGKPHSVTERLLGIRVEAPPGVSESSPAVFFPYTLGERETLWERGTDPLTRASFTGDHDQYGQPQVHLVIGVPRNRTWRAPPAQLQSPLLATVEVTGFAQPSTTSSYIADRLADETKYEILDDGRMSSSQAQTSALGLWERVVAWRLNTQELRCEVVAQRLRRYDGEDYIGLPLRQIGGYGALKREERLVLTEALLQESYKSASTTTVPPEEPPYLARGTPVPWTSDYPQTFRDLMAQRGFAPLVGIATLSGHIFHGGDAIRARGFFVATLQRKHDTRGLLVGFRDPFGNQTDIEYGDGYALKPTRITDARGMRIEAGYDYRTLQPQSITDPNGSETRYDFTPLGLLGSVVQLGRPTQSEGDTVDEPSTRFVYHFSEFRSSGQPLSVHAFRRTHYVTDPDDRQEVIETREYSDGFGRVIQVRSLADDLLWGTTPFGDAGLPAEQPANDDAIGQPRAANAPPNVVVSGWQTFDNKGRVVMTYEPFYSTGWDYAVPDTGEPNQRLVFFYDALSRVVRTVNPDGSETRMVYGVCPSPSDIDKPDAFEPSPWEVYKFDENDNAGRTPLAAGADTTDVTHYNTPTSFTIDAFDRVIEKVYRNSVTAGPEWYTVRHEYDIRGNITRTYDEAGRLAVTNVFDLADREIRSDQLDAGVRRSVLDVTGRLIERRDGRGALVLNARDGLNRLTHVWARDGLTEPLTLRERIVFGDDAASGMTRASAAGHHLLGRPYKHYDGAGVLTVNDYDHNGLPIEKVRQRIADSVILAGWAGASNNAWKIDDVSVDWEPPGNITWDTHVATLVDAVLYRTSQRYDALRRVKWTQVPSDVGGNRKRIDVSYSRGGALQRVVVDGIVFVEQIGYNARGQRTLEVYGSRDPGAPGPRMMTRYAFDPKTFRLLRVRTEKFTSPTQNKYVAAGGVLQDIAYEYDLAGNLFALHDRTPESGTGAAKDSLDRAFGYDPLYRLLSATGREADTPPFEPWDAGPVSADPSRTRSYEQIYEYDAVGNLTCLRHRLPASSQTVPTLHFAQAAASNRLASVTSGLAAFSYAYDAAGNVAQENSERHYSWDAASRLRSFRVQASGAEPSLYAAYLYDALGQRSTKLVRRQGGRFDVTVYIDGFFEHTRVVRGAHVQEFDRVHVLDNDRRIADIRLGQDPDDSTPAIRYQIGDHIASVTVLVSANGAWINREEFTPYGTTSFGSVSRKRFRFTGKERDSETGLYYHGARYYAPWLVRWMSTDPAGFADGFSPYQYARGRPLILADRSGLQSEPPAELGASGAPASAVAEPRPTSESSADNTSPNWQGNSIVLENHKIFDAIRAALGKEAGAHIRFKEFRKTTLVDRQENVFARKGAGFLQIDANYHFAEHEFAGRMLKEINDSGQKVSVEFADPHGNFPAQSHRITGRGLTQTITTDDITLNIFGEQASGATLLSKNLEKAYNLGRLVAIGRGANVTTPQANWSRIFLASDLANRATVMHEVFGHFYLATKGPNWKHGQMLSAPHVGHFPAPPDLPVNKFIEAVERFAH